MRYYCTKFIDLYGLKIDKSHTHKILGARKNFLLSLVCDRSSISMQTFLVRLLYRWKPVEMQLLTDDTALLFIDSIV